MNPRFVMIKGENDMNPITKKCLSVLSLLLCTSFSLNTTEVSAEKTVTPDDPVQAKPQGFFARLWQAIVNFFRSLFGIKKE